MKEYNMWGFFFLFMGLSALILGQVVISFGIEINISLYVFGVVIGMTTMGYWMYALACFLKAKNKSLLLSEES